MKKLDTPLDTSTDKSLYIVSNNGFKSCYPHHNFKADISLKADISAFFVSVYRKLFSDTKNGFSAFVKGLSKKLDTKLDTLFQCKRPIFRNSIKHN